MNFESLLSSSAPYGVTVLVVLKATAILLMAVAVAGGLRRASAGTRHVVWLVAIAGVLVLPALAPWSPLDVRILPASVPAVGEGALRPDGSASTPATAEVPSGEGVAPVAELARSRVHAEGDGAIGSLSVGGLLVALWMLVAALLTARLVYGSLAVRGIVRRARPLADEDWQGRLWDVADRLGIVRAPRVLVSDEVRVPFAAGFLDAMIVLPSECEGWTPGQRDAVLVHELGHVRRRDLLGHTLGRIACALYWFHPLVWAAARRLRDASERACDDLAIRLGSRPSDYAQHLLEIVTAHGRSGVPGVALAMAQRREFEGRMLAILDPALRRETPARWQSAALAGVLAAATLVVAAAAPAPRNEAAAFHSPIVRDASAASAPISDAAADPVVNRTLDRTTDADPQASDTRGPAADASEPAAPPDPVAAPDPPSGPAPRATEAASSGAAAPSGSPDVLARVLRTDSSARVRRAAAWALRQHADVPVALAALREAATDDPDDRVRLLSVWSIEASRNPDNLPVLGAVLRNDADENVREMAAWALGQSDTPDAAPILADLLASEQSEHVLATLAWAIGSIRPARAPDRLPALLTSSDSHTRLTAAWALSEIADPATLPAIREAVAQPQDDATMRALLRAWVRIDDSPDGLAALVDAPSPEVRRAAVRALAGRRSVDPWPWPWPRPILSP